MVHDAGVVARREAGAPARRGEREQLGEAEAAVAADARVRRLTLGVPGDERLNDRGAELLPQIERDVRKPEPVAGRARGDDGLGRAAGPLGVGAGRIEPEPERDPDRVLACAEKRDRAVHAAAHRNGDALG